LIELAEMSSTVCVNLRDSKADRSCVASKSLKTHSDGVHRFNVEEVASDGPDLSRSII